MNSTDSTQNKNLAVLESLSSNRYKKREKYNLQLKTERSLGSTSPKGQKNLPLLT